MANDFNVQGWHIRTVLQKRYRQMGYHKFVYASDRDYLDVDGDAIDDCYCPQVSLCWRVVEDQIVRSFATDP